MGRAKKAKPDNVSKTNPLTRRLKEKMYMAINGNGKLLICPRMELSPTGNAVNPLYLTIPNSVPINITPKNTQLRTASSSILPETTFKLFLRKPNTASHQDSFSWVVALNNLPNTT